MAGRSMTSRTGNGNQRLSLRLLWSCFSNILQAMVPKVKGWWQVLCHLATTNPKLCWSNLQVVTDGSYPKAAGNSTNQQRQLQHAEKHGKKVVFSAESKWILVQLPIYERATRCRKVHRKPAINSSKLQSRKKKRTGRRNTNEQERGIHLHKQLSFWLKDQNYWKLWREVHWRDEMKSKLVLNGSMLFLCIRWILQVDFRISALESK